MLRLCELTCVCVHGLLEACSYLPCGGRESFATTFCVEHATVQAVASVLGLADFSHPHHVCTFVPDHVEMMVVCLCTSGTAKSLSYANKKKKNTFFFFLSLETVDGTLTIASLAGKVTRNARSVKKGVDASFVSFWHACSPWAVVCLAASCFYL